jgi:hypothetical protein
LRDTVYQIVKQFQEIRRQRDKRAKGPSEPVHKGEVVGAAREAVTGNPTKIMPRLYQQIGATTSTA